MLSNELCDSIQTAFYRKILDNHFYVKFSEEEEFIVCLLFFEGLSYVLLMMDMSIIYLCYLIHWSVYFDLLATNFCNTMTNLAKLFPNFLVGKLRVDETFPKIYRSSRSKMFLKIVVFKKTCVGVSF